MGFTPTAANAVRGGCRWALRTTALMRYHSIMRGRVREPLALLLCLGWSGLGCTSDDATRKSARDGGAGDAAAQSSDASTRQGVLKGRVFDAKSGRGVPAAELASETGSTARAAANGSFELAIADAPNQVQIFRDDYAPTEKPVPDSTAELDVFLSPVEFETTFLGSEGLLAELPSGGEVEIPADAVVDGHGEKVHTEVKLQLAEVDGRARLEASALPHDLQARSGNKKGLASIERAVEIRLTDKQGVRLGLDETAGAEIKLRTRDGDTKKMPTVFSFDEKGREWRDEGHVGLAFGSTGRSI